MNRIKLFTTLFTTVFLSTVYAQCDIPNASFDNFNDTTVFSIAGPFTFEQPDGWHEGTLSEIIRSFHGVGIFNKYEGSDATNGVALKMLRSHETGNTLETFTKGYAHFDCDQIPNKLRGRYKFRGTGNFGAQPVVDTLKIAVKFSTSQDPVSQQELSLSGVWNSQISGNVKFLDITSETDTFQEFEIDFTDIIDQPSEFVSIHLMLKQGGIENVGPDFEPSMMSSEAIIDDLEFIYSNLSVPENDIRGLTVFPNPIRDVVTLKLESPHNKLNIELYDSLGRLIFKQTYHNSDTVKLNMEGNEAGVYMLKIISDDLDTKVVRLIKN